MSRPSARWRPIEKVTRRIPDTEETNIRSFRISTLDPRESKAQSPEIAAPSLATLVVSHFHLRDLEDWMEMGVEAWITRLSTVWKVRPRRNHSRGKEVLDMERREVGLDARESEVSERLTFMVMVDEARMEYGEGETMVWERIRCGGYRL